MLSMIVAASRNGVIGRDGDLPWHLSDDLKRFKALTTGKAIIMGRLTYDSIGRPLPNRRNIVVSRNADFQADGCEIVPTIDDVLALVADEPEAMLIGGGQLYALMRPYCQRIYLTRVHADVDGDTVFEMPSEPDWQLVECEHHAADERHEYAFDFETWERTEVP